VRDQPTERYTHARLSRTGCAATDKRVRPVLIVSFQHRHASQTREPAKATHANANPHPAIIP